MGAGGEGRDSNNSGVWGEWEEEGGGEGGDSNKSGVWCEWEEEGR